MAVSSPPPRMFFSNNGFFDSAGTANCRAVSLRPFMHIPRTHTLNPGDFFGLLFIRRPDQMPAKGAGGRKHSLKFKTGDDIGGALVTVDIVSLRIKDFTSRGDDDRPCLNGQFFFLVLKIDSLRWTKFFAYLTSPFGKKDTMDRINDVLQRN